MSFFNTVRCDYPLPDPEFQDDEFQTWDLGALFHRYLIAADGRLWRRRRGVDLFGKHKQDADDTETMADTHYHGDIRLCASPAKGWLEYRVRFTHGVVEWIRRTGEPEPGPADSLERLARNAVALEQERTARIEALLVRLEALDPEVAESVVETFGDRYLAARWLVGVHPIVSKRTPYEDLARGRREVVLNALGRILYGVYG